MRIVAVLLAVLLAQGLPESGASQSDGSNCIPQFIGCTTKVLTAPLNGSFFHYCFVSSSGSGAIQFSWTRDSGPIDWNRTTINTSGTTYLKNISIQIDHIKEYDEDTYVLTVRNDCGVQHSSIYVVVNPDGGELVYMLT